MPRHLQLPLCIVIALLTLSACGGATPAPAVPTKAAAAASVSTAAVPTATSPSQPAATKASTATQPTVAAQPTTVKAATAAPTVAVKAATSAPTVAVEELSLTDRMTGLDKLKSYRVRWLAEWKSTEKDKTETGNWEWTEEYTAEPRALHLTWKGADAATGAPETEMEMWQIGDSMYMLTKNPDGKAECMQITSEDQANQLQQGIFNPSLLGSVENARFSGNETVNGIASKHYKYDSKSTALAGSGQVSGDMWVAADGGYVVKDVMSWKGAAGLFGAATAGENGEGKWTWELLSANQALTISPPEDCGGAAATLPMMADAKGKMTIGNMTMYQSASKVADVVKFYKQEMVAAGYKAGEEQNISAEIAMLSFSKGDQEVQITIQGDAGKTQVIIQAGD